MKKLFKTLMAVMVAVLMSLSLVAFAACGPGTEDPNPNPNPEKPDDSGITGSTPEITAFLQALAAQETETAQFNFTYQSTSRTDGYHVYYEGENIGEKTDDGYTYSEDQTYDMTVDGKMNVKYGNADIVYSSKYTDMITDSEAEEAWEDEDNSYIYIFLRDWYAFTYADEEEVKDFTDIPLYFETDIKALFADLLDEAMGAISLGDIASMALVPSTGLSTAYLADKFGALTLEDGKAVADFNLAAYNLIQSVKEMLELIDGDTTIGDVLADETVKTLIEAYTASLTAQDVKDMLDLALLQALEVEIEDGYTLREMLEDMFALVPGGFDITMLIPAPDRGSTVYEYIVKLVSSEELKLLINLATFEPSENPEDITFLLDTTLDKVPLDFFLDKYADTSYEEVKAAFEDCTKDVTKTELNITVKYEYTEFEYRDFDPDMDCYITVTETYYIPTQDSISIKNLKIEYTLDGNTLTAISVDGAQITEYSTYIDEDIRSDGDGEVTKNIVMNEQTESAVISLEITLNSLDADYAFEDIGENQVVIAKEEWVDGIDNYLYLHLDDVAVEYGGYAEQVILTAILKVENGLPVGVELYDEDENLIDVDKDGKFTVTVTVKPIDTDGEPVQVPVELYLSALETESCYMVFVADEPINFSGEDDATFVDSMAAAQFYTQQKLYVNTVDGILSGIPSTPLAD